MKFQRFEASQVALAAGAAALLLTVFVAWHGTPIPGDVRVIREFQGFDLVRRNEDWINALGTLRWQAPLVIGALAVAALGQNLGIKAGSPKERTEAIWVLLAALVLRFLTVPLKSAAQAERPAANFNVRITEDFAGYGFPSGHVYSDVLIFGTLAIVAPALLGRTAGTAVRVFCLALIVLAGPARMIVGAHWPSDVAGGYLWGVAALCLALLAGRRLAGSR